MSSIKSSLQKLPTALNIVALALPISIGYGILSGLGPISGIIGLLVSLILGSFLGGVKDLIRTPTAVTTLVIAFALGEMQGTAIEKTQLAIFIFVLSGLFLMIIGKFDLAKYVKLMPYPLVKGITITIGILLISKSTQEIIDFSQLDFASNYGSVLLALSVVLAALLLERKSSKIPSIFIALLIPSLFCFLFGADFKTLEFNLEDNFQLLSLADLQHIPYSSFVEQIPSAVFIALYAALSSSLCVLILDGLTDEQYNLNKENFHLGIINIVSGLFGGIPSCGNLPASLININSAKSSRLVGIFAAAILLIFLFLFSHSISYIPSVVISAILFFLGLKLVDINIIRSLFNYKNSDNLVLLLTIIIGVFGSLFHAIIAGFTLSSILFMHRMRRMSGNLTVSGDVDQLVKKNKVSKALKERIQIINLNGPLFFGSAEDFYSRFVNLQNSSIIIVNLKQVPFMDDTGLNVIKKSIKTALEGNVEIYFTGTNYGIYKLFELYGIVNQRLTENYFYPSIPSCLKALKATHEES